MHEHTYTVGTYTYILKKKKKSLFIITIKKNVHYTVEFTL